MKYIYPEISECFDFEKGKINTLSIENPDFFRKIVRDFSNQINGFEGLGVLSENNKPLLMSQNVELLDSFIPFEINKKSLLNKLASAIEKNALSPENYEKTMEYLGETERFFENLSFESTCDIVFGKLSLTGIIKGISPEFRNDYDSLCEQIIDYFEIVNEYDCKKLFITVNFRSYINENDFELFSKTVLSHGYKVLLLENVARNKIECENRVIIDNDLCEIS